MPEIPHRSAGRMLSDLTFRGLARQATSLSEISAFYIPEHQYNDFKDGNYQVHLVVWKESIALSSVDWPKHYGVLLTNDVGKWLLHATNLRVPGRYQAIPKCGNGDELIQLTADHVGRSAVLLEIMSDERRSNAEVSYSSFGKRHCEMQCDEYVHNFRVIRIRTTNILYASCGGLKRVSRGRLHDLFQSLQTNNGQRLSITSCVQFANHCFDFIAGGPVWEHSSPVKLRETNIHEYMEMRFQE
jgi:hypothetical protein